MRTPLPLLERLVARSMDTVTRALFGYVPQGLNEEFVATLGLRRYFRLLRQSATVIRRLSKRYGDAHAQFLLGLAGMACGCPFCGYGHVYTANLLVFRDQGILHPLHPEVVAELFDLTDAEGLDRLARLLDGDDHEPLRTLALRMLELKLGRRQPTTDDDRMLQATLSVWAWTAECTIVIGMPLQLEDAVPHSHPVCRDRALEERYTSARAAASSPP